MSNKFTVIYNDSWMCGSHYQSLTKMRRIEQLNGETVADMLEREDLQDRVEFLFCGHPLFQGESQQDYEKERNK